MKHPYQIPLLRLWLRRHRHELQGYLVAAVGPYLVTGSDGRLRTVSRL